MTAADRASARVAADGGDDMEPTYDARYEADRAEQLFQALSRLPWDRHQINMYGKVIPAPRMFAWMGTAPGKLYGKPVPTIPWMEEAAGLADRLERDFGVRYDSCNVNMYRNQDDYLGWHIDPEDEGRWDHPIASISLGAERPFQWREYTLDGRKKKPTGEIQGRVLANGSLLIMPAGFQARYLHRLAKSSGKCGMRINLTFRRMAA